MPMTLTIRDEEMTGKTVNELSLEFLTERITVRELIRSRVYQEVQDHNVAAGQREFRGLVRPTEVEQVLNKTGEKKPRTIDWRKQCEKAIEAFEKKQILILVNDRQVESLDEEIELRPDTSVSFLRLTLLVGG